MSQNRERLLSVFEILKRDTNVDHPLSSTEIIAKLAAEGIRADRRAVYEDIRTLVDRGVDIATYEETGKGYYMREREFEFSELRLLTDAVLSAKFISKSQSHAIVNKIKTLTNKYDQSRLEKVNYLHKRIKCDNQAIFYNIDLLTEAIERGKQVRFSYMKYTFSRTLEKKDNAPRQVSPYHILWMNDYYYLVCRYPKYQQISNLRLDRICNIKIMDDPSEPVNDLAGFENGLDIAEYANRHIHMFAGKEERIRLKCKNDLLQTLQDKFGDDMQIKKLDENYFSADVHSARPGMLYFVLQMADGVEVLSPPDFRREVCDTLKKMITLYS
jgi:predicted DNA-binding transcriptional regulator YafY